MPNRVLLLISLLILCATGVQAQDNRSLTLSATRLWWPAGVDAPLTQPEAWGDLALSPLTFEKINATSSIRNLIAPRSDFPAILDGGMLSDWEDGLKTSTAGHSGELQVAVKHTVGMLYVAVGLPLQTNIPPKTKVEIVIEEPLGAALQPNTKPWRISLEAKAFNFQPVLRVDGSAPSFNSLDADVKPRAIFGLKGDGTRNFPVFEFAIPVNGPLATEADRHIGFAVYADFPHFEISANNPDAMNSQMIRWPAGLQQNIYAKKGSFGSHPDTWGDARIGSRPGHQECIWVPLNEKQITVDGDLLTEEWDAAGERVVEALDTTWLQLRTQRNGDNLLLAVNLQGFIDRRALQTITVYLDPRNDEGLEPRPDDRALRLSAANSSAMLETLAWNRSQKKWVQVDDCKWLASGLVKTGTQACAAEFSISLSSLGWPGPSERDQVIGLGVEVEAIAAPQRLLGMGAVRLTPDGLSDKPAKKEVTRPEFPPLEHDPLGLGTTKATPDDLRNKPAKIKTARPELPPLEHDPLGWGAVKVAPDVLRNKPAKIEAVRPELPIMEHDPLGVENIH